MGPMGIGRGVVVVADAAAAAALRPLLEVWRSGPGVRTAPWTRPGPTAPTGEELAALAETADALLVVGPRRRSPRTVLPGPCVLTTDGRAVPVAWLPFTSAVEVARFAATAAALHSRRATAPRPTLAVLGERQPRFDRLAERVVALARAGGRVAARRCTAYELSRDDCVAALATGPALALYVGHGRPNGWVGYAGMRAHHLAVATGRPGHRPVGALVSLTCRTASRRRTGLSFTESVVLAGVAGAALGAVGATHHPGNARWAVRIAHHLADATTVGQLVARLVADDPHAAAYRLIGDPTAPLLDAPAPEEESAAEEETP